MNIKNAGYSGFKTMFSCLERAEDVELKGYTAHSMAENFETNIFQQSKISLDCMMVR
jgi:hypothetical protein